MCMREGQPPPDTQPGEAPLPLRSGPGDWWAAATADERARARTRHLRRARALAWGMLLGGLQLVLLIVFLVPGSLDSILDGRLNGIWYRLGASLIRWLLVLLSAGCYFAFALL